MGNFLGFLFHACDPCFLKKEFEWRKSPMYLAFDDEDGFQSKKMMRCNSNNLHQNYKLTRKELGRGSFARVRECIEAKSRKSFAVKSIIKSKIREAQRVKNEIVALCALSHPNIIGLKDIFEDDKFVHLVTPICRGGDLFHRIVQKAKSPEKTHSEEEAALIVRKVFQAVDHCHSKGVIHRDLKPENVLLESDSPNAEVKLIDFGLSAVLSSGKNSMKSRVGTPYCIAPEIISCQKYSNKCDIWSVGVVLYMLLSGSPPFAGTTDPILFRRIKHQPVYFPRRKWRNISSKAKDLILLLLRKDPKGRPSAEIALTHPFFKVESYGISDKDNIPLIPKTCSFSCQRIADATHQRCLTV